MCTVTFIPTKSGFVFSSSRDERTVRPTVFPQFYTVNGEDVVYPKDEVAKGTWIAASRKKRMACLLNGGFENHIKKTNYRKSRGLILLESFDYDSIQSYINEVNLADIEPFTLLLIDYKDEMEFVELIWTGEKKHIRQVPNDVTGLWSSATLYSKEQKLEREDWFEKWLVKHQLAEDKNILNFHLGKHSDVDSNNILMKRGNDLQTISVSQLKVTYDKALFYYHDVLDNVNSEQIVV